MINEYKLAIGKTKIVLLHKIKIADRLKLQQLIRQHWKL